MQLSCPAWTFAGPRSSPASANLAFGLIVVVGLGALARLQPILGAQYPLNDGGLFAQMGEDLVRAGFWLPSTTSYNGTSIPFAYPPLGLYLLALLSTLLDAPAISVLRWLPGVLAVITILAMFALASELLRSKWRGLAAAAIFALLPRSYIWLVVGGGITRALGLLLALVALHQGLLLVRTKATRHRVLVALLAGLTFLSHPQAAVFLGLSLAILFAFHHRPAEWLGVVRDLSVVAVGALLVASPWLIAVITRHGIAPLLSAGQTGTDLGGGLSVLFSLAFTDVAVLDVLTAMAIVGLFLRVVRRQWLIPTWLVLTVLIDPRAGATYATVPLAMSVVPVLGALLEKVGGGTGHLQQMDETPLPTLVRKHWQAAAFVALLLFMALRTTSRTYADPGTPLFGLTPAHAAAMVWVAQYAPQDVEFAVVTGRLWPVDYVSEWFPVLAERSSVGTVQGSEWNGFPAFINRLAQNVQLQQCSAKTESCIEDWISGWRHAGAYVFLPKGQLAGVRSPDDCCAALRETLIESHAWRLAYDGPGASIFAPRE